MSPLGADFLQRPFLLVLEPDDRGVRFLIMFQLSQPLLIHVASGGAVDFYFILVFVVFPAISIGKNLVW